MRAIFLMMLVASCAPKPKPGEVDTSHRELVAGGLGTATFATRSHGYLFGGTEIALETRDGGSTWSNVDLAKRGLGSKPIDRWRWLSSKIALVYVRDPDALDVFRTADAGASFERLPVKVSSDVQLDHIGSRAWQCSGSIVDRSDDAGLTWQSSTLPRLDERSRRACSSISFADGSNGWVATAEGAFGTSDGGDTWTALPVPTGTRYRVVRTTGARGWVIEAQKAPYVRSIYQSTDGGAHFARRSEFELSASGEFDEDTGGPSGLPSDRRTGETYEHYVRPDIAGRPRFERLETMKIVRGRRRDATTQLHALRSEDEGRTWVVVGDLSGRTLREDPPDPLATLENARSGDLKLSISHEQDTTRTVSLRWDPAGGHVTTEHGEVALDPAQVRVLRGRMHLLSTRKENPSEFDCSHCGVCVTITGTLDGAELAVKFATRHIRNPNWDPPSYYARAIGLDELCRELNDHGAGFLDFDGPE